MNLFATARSTFRMARKNLAHGLFTIGGLVLGISTSLCLIGYLHHELSYDKFHRDWPLIYRVTDQMKFDSDFYNSAIVPSGWSDIIKAETSGVDHIGRINKPPRFNSSVRYKDKLFNEDNIIFIDSTILNILSFRFVHKKPGNPLSYPQGIMINDRVARKYFGDSNPIDQALQISEQGTFYVTAVIKDVPNSSFRFDFAILLDPPKDDRLWAHTLIKMNDNADPEAVQENLQLLIKGHFAEKSYAARQGMQPVLQPLADIHYSDLKFEYSINANIIYVYLFGFLVILILSATAFNFINMKMAEAATRIKEISMRKILGGTKMQIIFQMIIESQIIIGGSFLIAIIMVHLINPLFNHYVQSDIQFITQFNLTQWIVVIIGVIAFALLCSLFPSLKVWSHSFTNQNSIASTFDEGKTRHYLIGLQFFLSTIMVFGGLTINQQLRYFHSSKLGFRKNEIMVLKFPDQTIKQKFKSFKSELLQHHAITHVSFTQTIPGERASMAVLVYEKQGTDETTIIPTFLTDENFTQTLGVPLVTGRNFNLQEEIAQRNCLINLATAELMGWSPETAIGQKMNAVDLGFEGKVIGVTENFNFSSLHDRIEPLVIFPILDFPQFFNRILIQIDLKDSQQAIAHIEKVWNDFTSDAPFNQVWLTDNLKSQYQDEYFQSRIFNLFVGLFIGIAILGLFSLAYFDLERKTKEISIRKVLGASKKDITFSFAKSFLKMVLVAGLTALPISYFAAEKWLENFSFKTTIGIDLFLVAIFLNASVCAVTVFSLVYRKAGINPSLQLKQE